MKAKVYKLQNRIHALEEHIREGKMPEPEFAKLVAAEVARRAAQEISQQRAAKIEREVERRVRREVELLSRLPAVRDGVFAANDYRTILAALHPDNSAGVARRQKAFILVKNAEPIGGARKRAHHKAV